MPDIRSLFSVVGEGRCIGIDTAEPVENRPLQTHEPAFRFQSHVDSSFRRDIFGGVKEMEELL